MGENEFFLLSPPLTSSHFLSPPLTSSSPRLLFDFLPALMSQGLRKDPRETRQSHIFSCSESSRDSRLGKDAVVVTL